MTTLLEKALNEKQKNLKDFSTEELELAVAYARSQVAMSQVGKAIGIKHSNVYPWLCVRIVAACKQGLLK